MKKFVVTLAATGILLAACGNEETNDREEVEVQAPETESVEFETESEQAETEVEGQEDKPNQEDYAELPEYKTIGEQVGTDYTFEQVTDNEGNRILFLKDENGEKQYKTIFVKRDNRLEIIKIKGVGGQVFEGEI